MRAVLMSLNLPLSFFPFPIFSIVIKSYLSQRPPIPVTLSALLQSLPSPSSHLGAGSQTAIR